MILLPVWGCKFACIFKFSCIHDDDHILDVDDITFDHKKHRGKIPKRQQDAKDTTLVRKSTLNIRLVLSGVV